MKKVTGIISAIALASILLATNVHDYKLNPNVTQANIQSTICQSGWTTTIRPPASYTNRLKLEQLQDISFTDKNPKDYEEDHRVSLELGGNPTDPQNLVPQPYNDIVNGINLGAREKDAVEDFLHKQVCSGAITLAQAQDRIINQWAKIYLQIKGYTVESSTSDD